ncbi:TPA: transketolase family protein [Candidatus Spyradomonas excrementavium]|nr:transketolase family protein [Candidatus Spyradomonas excrementavium]
MIKILQGKDREKKSIRAEYGKTLVELGKKNPNIVALDADLSCSTQTAMFGKEFPERFFNMGIAEQDAMTTAAGLSTTGKIPFVSTFAMFATGRAWEQIRNSICYPRFNVKIVATHGGITVGEDGASHQALEDIAIMRDIPNMMVIVPADCTETREVIKFAAEYDGPVYIRLARTNVPNLFDPETYKFDPKKALVVKEGKDVTLVTNGETLVEALDCAQLLENDGISAEIIHMPVVKPVDAQTLVKSAKKTNHVITIENHSIIGGLGSAVCETLCENYPVKVKRIGINDQFGQSGEQRELMNFYGLTGEKLAQTIKNYLK